MSAPRSIGSMFEGRAAKYLAPDDLNPFFSSPPKAVGDDGCCAEGVLCDEYCYKSRSKIEARAWPGRPTCKGNARRSAASSISHCSDNSRTQTNLSRSGQAKFTVKPIRNERVKTKQEAISLDPCAE